MATKSDSKKWTNEEILTLIDAYKEEFCLYAINSPNYHNKHLRSEALKRVGDAVRVLKHHVTDKDCASKFHTLRSQYNIENAKVKMSKKSGTGTDNIYKPSLWYYEHLMFLDTFFTPRKSRNSLEKNQSSVCVEKNSVFQVQDSQVQDSQIQDYILSEDSVLVVTNEISDDDHSNITEVTEFDNESSTSIFSASEIPTTQYTKSTFRGSTSTQSPTYPIRPFPSNSPVTSSSSTSSSKKSKTSGDGYAEAVQSLADSLRQPVVVAKNDNRSDPIDPVDGFLMFFGSLLRNFQSEELRLDIMNTCIKTCINARTVDLQRQKNV